jgi:hypothetical protein
VTGANIITPDNKYYPVIEAQRLHVATLPGENEQAQRNRGKNSQKKGSKPLIPHDEYLHSTLADGPDLNLVPTK